MRSQVNTRPARTAVDKAPMTDNQMIRWITQTPAAEKVWITLSPGQKRRALDDLGGDTWHLVEVLEDAREVAN